MTGKDLTIYSGSNPQKAADQKYCHACGRVINLHAAHCVGCGAPQAQNDLSQVGSRITVSAIPAGATHNQIYCHGCGSLMHSSALQCPKCGAPSSSAVKEGSKDRVTAGLFAILLGGIGAHHFYLGNTLLGILYLLFFWTFIPMIVGFIEGIVYLAQSDQSFARKYN